jgi:Short C-terminal domain/Phospholipase_D-nuclease N-terminal
MPIAASSYPLLNVFWTIFEIFLWVIWIWILIWILIDIFRSRDLSGWAKALWLIFIIFIPLIGVLVYLIARGDKMHEHAVQYQRQEDQEARAYIRQAAGTPSAADQLAKLSDLHDRGKLTDAEFAQEKAKVISGSGTGDGGGTGSAA